MREILALAFSFILKIVFWLPLLQLFIFLFFISLFIFISSPYHTFFLSCFLVKKIYFRLIT